MFIFPAVKCCAPKSIPSQIHWYVIGMKVVQFKYIKSEHWAHDAIGSYSPAQRRKTIEVIEKMYRPVYNFILFFWVGGWNKPLMLFTNVQHYKYLLHGHWNHPRSKKKRKDSLFIFPKSQMLTSCGKIWAVDFCKIGCKPATGRHFVHSVWFPLLSGYHYITSSTFCLSICQHKSSRSKAAETVQTLGEVPLPDAIQVHRGSL